jgi:Carboxypeptidase regulatory-like domain
MKASLIIKLHICVVLFCVYSSSVVFSQGTSASVSGVVTDTTGAVIPNVIITARNLDTTLDQTAVCNSSGAYHVMPLPPGRYSITARLEGFNTSAEQITLTVNQAATIDFQLQVGSQAQTVTVAGGNLLLNTTTAEISTVVDQNTIEELPLNGRDPSSLLFLSPGVTNILNTKAGYNQLTDAFSTEAGGTAGGGNKAAHMPYSTVFQIWTFIRYLWRRFQIPMPPTNSVQSLITLA